MPNHKYRAFLAIPIPSAVIKQLDRYLLCLKNNITFQKVKWTPPKNFHITLKFLGNISEEQHQNIVQQIRTVTKEISPFDLEFTAIQLFPDHVSPKIIAAMPHPITSIVALSIMIEKIVVQQQIPAENRAFTPHLSLGRCLKKPTEKIDLHLPHIHFKVNKFKLFRSDATTEGVVYTPLSTISLKGA